MTMAVGGGCTGESAPGQQAATAVEQLGGSVLHDQQGFVVKVDLTRSRATDTDLAMLQQFAHLDRLHLPAAITDEGLRHVAGLTGLEKLDIQYTQVTDAGLEHLRGLTSLVQLYVHGSQVSDAGIEKLEQALPQLTVEKFPIARARSR